MKWIRGDPNTRGNVHIFIYSLPIYVTFTLVLIYYYYRSFLSKFAVLALPDGGTTISREMYEQFELAQKNSTETSSDNSYDEFEAEKHDKTVMRRTRYNIDTRCPL